MEEYFNYDLYDLVISSDHLETLKIKFEHCELEFDDPDVRVNVASLNCPNLSTLHIDATGYYSDRFCLYHSNLRFKGLLTNIILHCPKIEDYNGYETYKKDTRRLSYKAYMEMCTKRCPENPEYNEMYSSNSNSGYSSADGSDANESGDIDFDDIVRTQLVRGQIARANVLINLMQQEESS